MKLEKNASVCMKALPFWMLPYTFYMYYLSLFLMEKGFSSSQITQLMTFANASSLVFSFFASPIVDRLGRKNTLLVFDLLSSAVPAGMLLFWQSFIPAAIAMTMTGLNRIMSTAFYLIMIEDTDDRNSMDSMNVFNIISVVAGVATPLAGIIVNRMGLVSAEKLFLLVSFVLMTVQAIIRHIFIAETPTGKSLKSNAPAFSFSTIVRTYQGTIKCLLGSRSLLSALLINAIMYVYYNIGTTTSLLFTPYFAQYRNLSGIILSTIGAVYSIGTLFSMLVINPRICHENVFFYILFSGLISLLGFFLMILCPQGNQVVLFLSVALLSLSYGILKSSADAVLAMETKGEFGAGVFSFSFVLSAVLSILSLQLVDVLYVRSPNWMFGLSAILVGIMVIVCLFNIKAKEANQDA